jgi:hypothetical protein
MVRTFALERFCHQPGTDSNTGAIAGEQWPELLGALFQASQSADPGQREGAFRIFATTPGIIERQHEETVLAAFAKGFKDDDVSVHIQMLIFRERCANLPQGPIVSNGSFCVFLPIDFQEVSTEVLLFNTRYSEYPSSIEGSR